MQSLNGQERWTVENFHILYDQRSDQRSQNHLHASKLKEPL
jgi:hypothetical protein